MYRVIKFFRDLQDNNHAYHVGDSFPHNGKVVSEDRLKELSSKDNKRHEPLIEKVEDAEATGEPVEGFMNPPEEVQEEAPKPKEEAPKPKKKRGRPRNDAK